MKVLSKNEFRFTFDEVAELLKEKLEANDKLNVITNDLTVQHDEHGNFVVHHEPDEYSC